MRRSEATRYARWSAFVAFGVLVVAASIYTRRAWQHSRSLRAAPPAVPATVQQRSLKFSLSKTDGDRTLFTVEAAHAIAFTQDNRNVLDDVGITIFGRSGDRRDRISTRQCEYFSDTGRVSCRGDVHVELENARDAAQRPGRQVVRADTSNVTFDRTTGQSRSDQPVLFAFPYGQGRAVGFTYDSDRAVVRLQHDVALTLRRTPGAASAVPIEVAASSLEYTSENGIVRLSGPVHLQQGGREMTCAALTIELSSELRARRMLATGRPEVISRDAQGSAVVSAEKATLEFTSSGAPTRLLAEGSARGSRKTKSLTGEQRFDSDAVDAEFNPASGLLQRLTATGNVRVETPSRKPGGGSERLTTSALLLRFAGRRPGGAELEHAETLAPATVELASPDETTLVRGDRLSADYAPHWHLRQVIGRQGIEIERRVAGRPVQVTRSSEGLVDFAADQWTVARQSGNVRFEERGSSPRRARADGAQMVRATDALTLTGRAELSDEETDTAAPAMVLNQRTGEARGDGGVRTTYRRAEPQGVTNFAPQPAHITAEHLVAARDSGRAVYSGRARFWQGDAVIQADTIELRRKERLLLGTGNVNALLPQAATPAETTPGSTSAPGSPAVPAPAVAGNQPVIWAVHAAKLTYRSAEAVAVLEQNVRADSRLGRIASARMEMILNSTAGVQQLTRAVATGGVTVWQRARRGTSERADYTAADGSFVLSGGNPTLFDADQGTTTGRELTFFLADDRILVDSGDGTRTVSRHRIQK
jgi:lipopolysaccharide export system protein LptA